MTEEPVLYAVAAGTARITFNRPDRLNALTRDLLSELGAAVADAAARDDVRVVSLTGAGRGFCAGQDLAERDPRKLDGPLDLAAIQCDVYHPILTTIAESPKPFVACVNGIAAGAGAGFALACDIVLAAEGAKFAFSFAKVGLSVDAGLGRALVRGLGLPRAKALLLLGETISAADAEHAGLIWRAVPDAAIEAEHEALLARLAQMPRGSLAGIKAATAAAHRDLADYLETEARAQGRAGAHPDYAEGVLAFLEKRPAEFS